MTHEPRGQGYLVAVTGSCLGGLFGASILAWSTSLTQAYAYGPSMALAFLCGGLGGALTGCGLLLSLYHYRGIRDTLVPLLILIPLFGLASIHYYFVFQIPIIGSLIPATLLARWFAVLRHMLTHKP